MEPVNKEEIEEYVRDHLASVAQDASQTGDNLLDVDIEAITLGDVIGSVDDPEYEALTLGDIYRPEELLDIMNSLQESKKGKKSMKLIMENWRGFIKEDQDEAEEVEELEPATADEDPEEDAAYPPWVQDDMKVVSADDERIKWWRYPFDRLDTGEGEWKNKVIPSTPDDNPNLSEPGDERWSLRSDDALRSYPVITYPGEEAPGWIQRYLDRLLWVAPLGVNVDTDGRLNMLGSDYYARQFHYGADEWAGRGINTAAAIAEWQHKEKLKKVNKLRKIIELGGGLKELVARAEKVRRNHDIRNGPAKADEHFSDALRQTKTFVMDKFLGDDE